MVPPLDTRHSVLRDHGTKGPGTEDWGFWTSRLGTPDSGLRTRDYQTLDPPSHLPTVTLSHLHTAY